MSSTKKPCTRVTTLQIPHRRNTYLVFGDPIRTEYQHSDGAAGRLTIAYFEPDQVFGLSLQSLNAYGITDWDTHFFRATHPGEQAHLITAACEPAAERLISFYGKTQSLLAKEYLGTLQAHSLAPSCVTRLHRLVAPYLMVGVLPTHIINDYIESRGLSHV